MMTTLLPKDADNNVIQALRLRNGGAHAIAVGAVSAQNTAAFDEETKVISLYATVPVYIAFGSSNVTATTSDHYFPAGIYYDVAICGGTNKSAQQTHISAIRASEDWTLYLSEKI